MRVLLSGILAALLLSVTPAVASYDGAIDAMSRKDEAAALREARQGADQGDPRAQRLYGGMLYDGIGTKKNAEEAVRWLRLAADKGDAIAQRGLANAYFTGTGVRKDLVQAYLWASLAAKAGDLKADALKTEVGGQLTRTQKRDGDRQIKEWQPGKSDAPTVAAAPPAAPRQSEMPRRKLVGTGSGFIVSTDGNVVTNDHVVRSCKEVRVRRLDESESAARIVATSRDDDLALLKADLTAKAVATFRSGKAIRQGDAVVAFGFPLSGILASSGNLTQGNITALAGVRDDERYLQISTPIQPGNSGGPLLDMNARIVGVTSASLRMPKSGRAAGPTPQNVNFAIKGSVAADFLRKHGVKTEDAGSATHAMKPADIAARAKRFTVRIECLS